MYCPGCKRIIDDDCIFCTKCGQRVSNKVLSNNKIGSILFKENCSSVIFDECEKNTIFISLFNKNIAMLNSSKFIYCDIPYGKYCFFIKYVKPSSSIFSKYRTKEGVITVDINDDNPDLIVDIHMNYSLRKINIRMYPLPSNSSDWKQITTGSNINIYTNIKRNFHDWNELIQVKEVEHLNAKTFYNYDLNSMERNKTIDKLISRVTTEPFVYSIVFSFIYIGIIITQKAFLAKLLLIISLLCNYSFLEYYLKRLDINTAKIKLRKAAVITLSLIEIIITLISIFVYNII